MMKALLITLKGMEEIAKLEVKELLGKDSDIRECSVLFDAETKEICKLTYLSRSAVKVMSLIEELEFKDIEDVKISNDYKNFIKGKFAVRSLRKGQHGFTSLEVEQTIGKQIEGEVDLENPDTTFLAFIINNKIYFGVDFSGIDLSKRDYKIFSNKESLKGTLAYYALRKAEYEEKKFILDPFAKDGVIVIEAAMMAVNKPINFFRKDSLAFTKFFNYDFSEDEKEKSKIEGKIKAYDSFMQSVSSIKKNAKIASVSKVLEVSRNDVDWLDIKMKEKEVDCIVSYPPQPAKHNVSSKDLEKVYNEFFYQADYILKESARIVLISKSTGLLKKAAQSHKFKLLEETEVWQGQQLFYVAVFARDLPLTN